jgi:ArsR family transcriptional regulator
MTSVDGAACVGRPESSAALRRRATEVAGLMKLLSHPNRLLIACELTEGERSVAELERATGAAQPNLSRDLARMRADGLVIARRQSKSVFYRLADDRLERLIEALCAAFAPAAPATGRRKK